MFCQQETLDSCNAGGKGTSGSLPMACSFFCSCVSDEVVPFLKLWLRLVYGLPNNCRTSCVNPPRYSVPTPISSHLPLWPMGLPLRLRDTDPSWASSPSMLLHLLHDHSSPSSLTPMGSNASLSSCLCNTILLVSARYRADKLSLPKLLILNSPCPDGNLSPECLLVQLGPFVRLLQRPDSQIRKKQIIDGEPDT